VRRNDLISITVKYHFFQSHFMNEKITGVKKYLYSILVCLSNILDINVF
jgi:hypothetical protein